MRRLRIYRVSDSLLAVVLPSGRVVWLELDPVPLDQQFRGKHPPRPGRHRLNRAGIGSDVYEVVKTPAGCEQ